MFVKKIFKYFEPAWTGTDGKISLRASLAIAFSFDFMKNLSHAIWSWDGGRSLEGLSLTLGIEAGLIVALLGLTTYQNMQNFGKGNGTSGYYIETREVKEISKTKETKDEVQRVEGSNEGIETPE